MLEHPDDLLVPPQMREPVRIPEPLGQPLLRQATRSDVTVEIPEDTFDDEPA
jgi:hypothetical protein